MDGWGAQCLKETWRSTTNPPNVREVSLVAEHFSIRKICGTISQAKDMTKKINAGADREQEIDAYSSIRRTHTYFYIE